MARNLPEREPMSPEEFRLALDHLDLSLRDAARLFGVDYQRVIKWSRGASDISPMAALILRYLCALDLDPNEFAATARPLVLRD